MSQWNALYPIDKWWRDKHKVAFNSQQHRQQDVTSMRMEFEEDLLFAQAERDRLLKQAAQDNYVPGKGTWLKKPTTSKPSQEEIDRDFEKLSITKLQTAREEIVNGKKRIVI